MEQGNIAVSTENIFPIIKKFLYSDHEIFLRELVSNAVDATTKLKHLASIGEVKEEIGDTFISLSIDKENKTLTIKDQGIGMTEEEVKKYINQVAFSSAGEFLDKYKDQNSIIGHFGLGFYSAFMVAEKVEIRTKSWKAKSKAVVWECDGNPEFTLDKCDKKDRGTEIILHLAEDSMEYLEETRVQTLLDKYCRFLPIEICFGEEEGKPKQINVTKPAWTKAPNELTEDDYKAFYKQLYPHAEPPLFWIHLNVDYPFNLTGILYFPKVNNNMELKKDKIQLYCNQVFVTDSVEEIVPEWLMLLHGVIDSPDIPLNVSRSYLQGDPNVKKINSHITKKVADKLEELFKEDRKEFEKNWEAMGVFVKYGMLSDDKFQEKAKNFALLKDIEGNHFNLDEYKNKIEGSQRDKNGNLIYLYSSNKDEQFTYIKGVEKAGYHVVLMDEMIDPHFIQNLESKLEKTQFKRVDAGTPSQLIELDGAEDNDKVDDKENEQIQGLFKEELEKESISMECKALSENDQPVFLTQSEFGRRFQDMSRLSGQANMMPEMFHMVVNTNHAVIQKLTKLKSQEKKTLYVQHLRDMALLSQNKLSGEKLAQFIERSSSLML